MSKRFLGTCLFLFIALFGLSGCDTCDPAGLLPPDLISPDWREIVSGGTALLEWSYPDTCEPDDFEIILSQDRDFAVIEHTQLVSGSESSWTTPALDPAEEYFWRVRAKVGSTYGQYSLERRSFFTGPICSAGDLVMPGLQLPAWGGIFERGYDSLEWSWPLTTCIPESYRVEVSMDPGFVDTTYNGGTGTPGTRWGFGSTPPPATQFWWRITPYADGAYGPPSLAKMFWTDPVCSGASLVRPEALTPLDNDTVNLANPIFTWEYPDPACVPEGFHLTVYDDPELTSVVLDADNPTLAAVAMQAGVTLPDCAEYWWQVSVYSEGVESLPSLKDRFIVDASGACDCAPGATTIPVIRGPEPFEVLPDTNASLRWRNPGGCFPDGFSAKVSSDHEYVDTSLDLVAPAVWSAGYDPPGLEPATQYWWKVAYYVEDAGSPVIGDYSPSRSFFTGPECGSIADLVPPVLVEPADGSVVDTLTPMLWYLPGDPACIPDGYLINLQDDPTFAGTNLLGEIPFPVTGVSSTTPLTDCTMYYWKVSAVQDGSYGPESEVFSFYVDESGTCAPPGIPGFARKNAFCRLGTFPEHFEPIYTFETGDPILAIARNPFNIYLKVAVVDPLTLQVLEPEIFCWSLLDAFEPREGFDFETLDVEDPPPTPTPTPTPTPKPACSADLGAEDCKAFGGQYDPKGQKCHCP